MHALWSSPFILFQSSIKSKSFPGGKLPTCFSDWIIIKPMAPFIFIPHSAISVQLLQFRRSLMNWWFASWYSCASRIHSQNFVFAFWGCELTCQIILKHCAISEIVINWSPPLAALWHSHCSTILLLQPSIFCSTLFPINSIFSGCLLLRMTPPPRPLLQRIGKEMCTNIPNSLMQMCRSYLLLAKYGNWIAPYLPIVRLISEISSTLSPLLSWKSLTLERARLFAGNWYWSTSR